MNKLSLEDFNISEEQYFKYKVYKTKLASRQKKIEFIKNKFDFVVFIVLFIIFIYFIFSKDTISIKITNLYTNGLYFKLILFILGLLFLSLLLYSLPGSVISGLISWFLSFLGIPTVFGNFCDKIIPNLLKEKYYDTAEKYELHEVEYQKHIDDLKNKYPDIVDYNYDKRLYFCKLMDEIIESEIQFVNNRIILLNKQKQKEYWLEMDGIEFENEVSTIYKKLGFKVETTRAVADGGVDIKLWKDGIYSIVQCKNHNNKVGPSVVRDLFGTMNKEKALKAILICSGGFNSGVYDFIKGLPIELIDINQFIEIVNKLNPHQHELVNEISRSLVITPKITHEFKLVGKVNVLFAYYEKIIFKDNKIIVSYPIENQYCVFETIEKAEEELELLTSNNINPFSSQCFYEIAEWRLNNKFSYYSQKKLYYIRALMLEDKFFIKKNSFEEHDSININFKKKGKSYWNRSRY